MGAWGGIIMSFFGSVFATMTLALSFGWKGPILTVPFVAFVAIALAAALVIRGTGDGVSRSERAGRVIMWSSIGEGIGLFVAANLVVNLHHPELLLPAMALVVGLHFVPMAFGVPFRPFLILAVMLVSAAVIGGAVDQPLGSKVAGFTAAASLWVAALLAVRRDKVAKSGSHERRFTSG